MEMTKYCCVVLLLMCILFVNIGYCGRIQQSNDPKTSEYTWYYKTEAQKYYEKVPEEKQTVFIKHFLADGLQKTSSRNKVIPFPAMSQSEVEEEFGEPPSDFSTKLLTWTKKSYSMTDENVHDLVQFGEVCIPKGCYDPSDIGSNCCVF